MKDAYGPLRPYWCAMTTLELVDAHGRGQSIQIAALPTDEAGSVLLFKRRRAM